MPRKNKHNVIPLHHDPFYAKIAKNIRTHGVHLMGVMASPDEPAPPFTYTIGLFEKYGFEVILFGVPYHHAGVILNDVTASLNEGFKIKVGEIYNPNPWVVTPVKFMKAKWDLAMAYVVQAYRYYKIEPELLKTLQMVVPDRKMKFPEDPVFEHDYMDKRQPLLY